MELTENKDAEEGYTGNPVAHGAARIPVSVYINGTPARYEARQRKAGTSDLANGVYTLLEAYAAGISDKANLADYLQDQFLALIGVDTTEGEVIKMRKAREIELKGNKNESDVKFIAQDQADGAVEHFLDRIEKAIFDTTLTPRMNDLAGATATEIKMKYAGLDIKVGKKETYFMESLRQFVATITDMLNTRRLVEAGTLPEDVYDILTGVTASPKSVVLYNPDWVSITLNRNLPQNYKEIADIVAVLAGKVPDSYLYELLWFIDDPVKALEEMKAQKAQALKDNMAAMGYSEDSFGSQNTGDENPDDSTA
jgi:hypothetical protein